MGQNNLKPERWTLIFQVYKYKPNLKSEDDETFESFCADDGSGESGDETGAANGASPMDEDTISPGNVRGCKLPYHYVHSC